MAGPIGERGQTRSFVFLRRHKAWEFDSETALGMLDYNGMFMDNRLLLPFKAGIDAEHSLHESIQPIMCSP
ncbi:hypothetical protein BHS06_09760 [Myxococcus xanthus]|nr:hypothetical protein BHS06_09760 [Myxococcus xanthus]